MKTVSSDLVLHFAYRLTSPNGVMTSEIDPSFGPIEYIDLTGDSDDEATTSGEGEVEVRLVRLSFSLS